MKATELMIGDWVLVNGITRQVSQITKHKIGYHLSDKECVMHYARLHDVNPIPLTAEILEKSGWILVENEYRSPEDIVYKESLRLQIGEDGNAFWWIVGYVIIIPINYVHELQHALRLCGLNELADNFRVE